MKFYFGVLAALLIITCYQHISHDRYRDGAIAGALGAGVGMIILTWKQEG